MVTSFRADSWKMSKGAMVVARGKKESTLYVSSGSYSRIAVASSEIDAGT